MTEAEEGVWISMSDEPNKANIKAWVDALRSGEFNQAIGVLRRDEPDTDFRGATLDPGHCCLGVACEVAARAGVKLPDGWQTHAYLPGAVISWLGLTTMNPVLSSEGGSYMDSEEFEQTYSYVTATLANDSLGWDFAKIADSLEANYLGEAA